MNEKKIYSKPILEVEKVQLVDVITVSIFDSKADIWDFNTQDDLDFGDLGW